ncbi:MAG: ABC transporter ATP-binding protein [Candidatus Pelagibacter sp.]|nr:ABC transporter ATP-binding protein [Candidatus Pelagibacter sp.]
MDERHLEPKVKLMSFLKIDNLNIDYEMRRETINAARNVNIEVNRGEILGIVGESGSGKSTVANAIINLIDEPGKISSGSITLDGINIQEKPETILKYRGKKIGLIFQDPQTSLNPLITIGDQLIETIQTHLKLNTIDSRIRAINLLKEVGIKDAENRFNDYPHQFSGGMRQRVVISLALCCEPELLIADEPTTALDVSIQSQILELIKRLTKERNLAVILITHDMGVIAETVDRVAVMKNGNLVEIGLTREILINPKEIYTKSLVSSVPPTNKKISRFKIIEKDNKTQNETNIKILNRWNRTKITSQDLVKVKNLHKNFSDGFFTETSKDSLKAVNDVTFNIKEGESFGLVGESGSGKSTIAKMIVNLFKPNSGDIFFDNICINRIKDKNEMMNFRKQIQMIFQDPYSSLNGRLKVRDIVAEPIKLHNPLINGKDLESYIYDLLESVELSKQSANRFPHEFSGGQRQRISIARALATQPRLLVCDEPTSALDVSIQAQILNLLKDLQEQLNLTILFISHDLPVVRQMCDRIGVLRNGELCEVSDTEKLFTRPSHDYTKELLNLMPKIESIYDEYKL